MTQHQLLDALEDKPLYRDEIDAPQGLLMDACRQGWVNRFHAGADCYQVTDEGLRELARLRAEVVA